MNGLLALAATRCFLAFADVGFAAWVEMMSRNFDL